MMHCEHSGEFYSPEFQKSCSFHGRQSEQETGNIFLGVLAVGKSCVRAKGHKAEERMEGIVVTRELHV
jgi:hypothetical protein